jgi:hypothetical protein
MARIQALQSSCLELEKKTGSPFGRKYGRSSLILIFKPTKHLNKTALITGATSGIVKQQPNLAKNNYRDNFMRRSEDRLKNLKLSSLLMYITYSLM